MSRRSFIKSAAAASVAAGAAGAFLGARRAQAQDNRALSAGLVGCGGRGTGAAHQYLESSENVKIVALADLFQDRLDGARNSLQNDKGQVINDDMCFVGFDAYEKILDADIDIILNATPPHFRPAQFAAAIEAGKHVFMEKPLAVDPVGARQIMETADLADEKGLSVVVGTQRRHQQSYVECRERVLEGEIGDIVAARVYWVGGPLGGWDRTDTVTNIGDQVRSWFHYAWLSGDHLVEQHVHNIDIGCWFLDKAPVAALGMGYRARKTYGDSYDFFAIDYEFGNGLNMASLCRQVADCDNNVSEWLVGTEGYANCWGETWDLDGNRIWRFEGDQPNPYVQEHADLVNSIRAEEPINDAHGVAVSVMAAVMGRESAYTGKRITWDQMMTSELTLGPAEYDLNADFEAPPVRQPGLYTL